MCVLTTSGSEVFSSTNRSYLADLICGLRGPSFFLHHKVMQINGWFESESSFRNSFFPASRLHEPSCQLRSMKTSKLIHEKVLFERIGLVL